MAREFIPHCTLLRKFSDFQILFGTIQKTSQRSTKLYNKYIFKQIKFCNCTASTAFTRTKLFPSLKSATYSRRTPQINSRLIVSTKAIKISGHCAVTVAHRERLADTCSIYAPPRGLYCAVLRYNNNDKH